LGNTPRLSLPAIPDKIERLLRPVIKSTPESAADRSLDDGDRFESQLIQWEQRLGEFEDEGLEPPEPCSDASDAVT
jgi:hypothetical protein